MFNIDTHVTVGSCRTASKYRSSVILLVVNDKQIRTWLTRWNHDLVASGPNPHKSHLVLENYMMHDDENPSRNLKPSQKRTVSLGSSTSLLTSSRPACTLSTVFAITLAYFRPFSPSNTTPEFRMILALPVPPRAMRRYPSTERWDVSVLSVFSSSGGTGMAVVVAIVLWLDEDGLACVGRGRVVFLRGLSALRIGISFQKLLKLRTDHDGLRKEIGQQSIFFFYPWHLPRGAFFFNSELKFWKKKERKWERTFPRRWGKDMT